MEKIDHIYTLFRRKKKFNDFWQALASLYWRINDKRYTKKKNAKGLKLRIKRILVYNRGSSPITQALWQFFNKRFNEIVYSDVRDEFRGDLFEARDHACAGYYSTALFVLGRAIEKALYKIGKARNISSIIIKFSNKKTKREWSEASFYFMNKALYKAKDPVEKGAILDKKQYSEINKLISYRNDAAHKEYRNLPEKKARREMRNATAVLEDLSEILKHYRLMKKI